MQDLLRASRKQQNPTKKTLLFPGTQILGSDYSHYRTSIYRWRADWVFVIVRKTSAHDAHKRDRTWILFNLCIIEIKIPADLRHP